MTRRPDLYATIRGDKLLLRGPSAQHCARTVSNDHHQWSDIGRGWVVESELLGDALAYAETAHLLAVVTDLDKQVRTA